MLQHVQPQRGYALRECGFGISFISLFGNQQISKQHKWRRHKVQLIDDFKFKTIFQNLSHSVTWKDNVKTKKINNYTIYIYIYIIFFTLLKENQNVLCMLHTRVNSLLKTNDAYTCVLLLYKNESEVPLKRSTRRLQQLLLVRVPLFQSGIKLTGDQVETGGMMPRV